MAVASEEVLQAPSKMGAYAHVIRALVLRDMRTRFGGSHWGYAVLVLWPVAHIFVMVGIMAFRGVPSPMGDSPLLFVATGCVPLLTFQYISREVMKAVVQNKPLIYYPQVKVFDLMIARLLVEIVKGFTGLIVVFAILASLGVNPIPVAPVMAIGAYCAAVMLGIGFGAVNIAIVSFFPAWQIGYILVTITMYMACGVFYLPHMLPDQIYDLLKYNPMTDIVEWTRLAYEPNLGVQPNYMYALLFGAGACSIGLGLERTIVRRFL